jgi:hypothetical protein
MLYPICGRIRIDKTAETIMKTKRPRSKKKSLASVNKNIVTAPISSISIKSIQAVKDLTR